MSKKSMLTKLFSSLDFMDDFPKDPLTGGDGHIDDIKAHLYYDHSQIQKARSLNQGDATALSEPILKVDHLIVK